MAKYTRYLFNL
jgi:hypothetical protein